MQSVEKKIILITGASDGVGKETAATLAKEGHTIIIHGRNKQKTENALEEIKSRSRNRDIEMFLGDFLTLAGVKAFAEQIKKNYDHIDILINNAGAQFTDIRETTSEGLEKHMAINVFAPMLLTTLLLDLLKKSQSARVITVSSDSHRMPGKVNLNDIELENSYSMARAYAQSKLYILWIMNHFIAETRKAGINNIAFNCVHPGSTNTGLGRESTKSFKWKLIYFIWQIMTISIDKAASSSVYAASAPELEGVSGKYFGPKGEEQPSIKNYSPENEARVWNYSRSIISKYL